MVVALSGTSLNAAENPAPVMHNAVLPVTVSIAGPQDLHGNLVIDLRGHPEVNILVRNASDKPMTLTTNGWVALYISAIDGKALPQPIVVRRSSLFLREHESHNSRHRGIYNPGGYTREQDCPGSRDKKSPAVVTAGQTRETR
jgi:hypothetical protein